VIRYRIQHRAHYRFNVAVRLGPHRLRVRPRESHALRIETSSLTIDPSAAIGWHFDAAGNSVATLSFDRPSHELTIDSDVVVQKTHVAGGQDVDFEQPFRWSREDAELLAPYRETTGASARDDEVTEWLDRLGCGDERLNGQLLKHINETIASTLTCAAQETTGVQRPEATLAAGSGTSRDFAALFIEAVRRCGMAARFVTGYLCSSVPDGSPRTTHAWAEVYLPDSGWIGFDPTTGLVAAEEHVAVAVARRPDQVPPVEGGFGGVADAAMDTDIRISRLSA
jgi:transglutaminase-like putative cysteine protease